ncbi:MAG TPA: AAA family ATPase [Gaiella sp.]|nr:AAA family ATPase [Gaiella sp.]
MISCSQCGRENPDDARFCNGCGAPLVAETPPREERKIVTAVFVDLVGSTARAETLDPEDVRGLLRRYHETLRRELERHGGTVEKFIGDAVVAVYGAPTAHEDDPERAVRAALAVRDAIGSLNDRDERLDLHVRIGVATGPALVSLDANPSLGESMVAGDVMNTAARIQSAAPVDGILVGSATYRGTERVIVYRPHDAVAAKGKVEPVEVWEAVEALGRAGGLGDPQSSPLVGREHERALLLGAFARIRVDRSAQLVTLVGVPGIGKSRLVAELGQAVLDDEEIITWRYGRCLPYGDGMTFWALGEIVKAQTGIHENDDAAVVAAKLERAVADLVPEAEQTWVRSSLEPLVGLVPEDVALRDRRTELFAGWRIFLESLAEHRPLVLVIDDLQWADDGLLDFVDGLVDLVEGVPLLVVACARPELLERRPNWGGGKRNALTVSLGPLSGEEAQRLVESLLGRDPADEKLREAVVERAAGNPLYAEEFVRMQTARGEPGGLPESVLGIVTARVDLLPPAEKELLRDAAVMGSVVWSDGLRAVSGQDAGAVDELLRSLGRKEFLRRDRRSAVRGATQHAFVHSLVRDAVYGQLPRPDRVDRHVRIAGWIESLPDDRREDRAELLAHHYLQAIELARSAGLDVADLEPRAATALREAGMRAFAIGAFPATVRALRAAAEWLPGGLDARALRALGKALTFAFNTGLEELELAFDRLMTDGATAEAAVAANDISLAYWRHGDGAEAARWTERALELAPGLGKTPEHVYVIGQAARHYMVAGRQERAVALAEEALALADALREPGLRAGPLTTRAIAKSNAGDVADLRRDLDEATALAREHDLFELTRVHINRGSTLMDLGDIPGAIEAGQEGLALCERLGVMEGSGRFILGNQAEALFVGGEWDEAEAIADDGLDHARRTGGTYHEPLLRFIQSELRLVRDGRADEAAESARQQIALARERADDQAIFPVFSGAAWILARTANEVEAAEVLDELLARRRANPTGLMAGGWTVHVALALERLGRSGELVALGEPSASRFLEAALGIDEGRFEDAAQVLQEIGAPELEAEARLLAARAEDAGGSHLARARQLLEGLGATARLGELDAVPQVSD